MADNCLRKDVNGGKIVTKGRTLPPRQPHWRRCWDCGNVAQHADSITPHVLCQKCGSQDTRSIVLKNCPFCGGDAEIEVVEMNEKQFLSVCCSVVGCPGFSTVSLPPQDHRRLINKWNTRVGT